MLKMPEIFSSIFDYIMAMEIFNSRKKEYKSKVSALREYEKVKFKIVLPRSMNCSGAYLVVTKENEEPVYYSMYWAGMNGEFHENWDIHFSATTSGLYYYHFELDTPWGKNYICNFGSGIGKIGKNDEFLQVVYDKDFSTPDFIKGGIIYQIFPDRFYNSGKKKHGVDKSRVMLKWGETPIWQEELMNGIWNNDYFGGDLKGIEQKLPYIKSLGVNCIYLNPIFEAHSNHRYDTADYEKIDALLGTQEDFKSLCKKAKSMGIHIILDGVFSHTGCDSKYFNMYSHYDTVGAYNSKESSYYSWYKFKSFPNDYESWWGIKLLPEVEEENESYRKYICSQNGILRKWMRLGASGWRLDVADELPDVFLDDLRKAVKAENKDAFIIGEVWENATTKVAYGQRRRYLEGRQLDSVMNYPFANAIIDFVKYKNSEHFVDCVMDIVESYPPCVLNCLMNHIGTHDTVRAITALAGVSCDGKDRKFQYENNRLSKPNYENGVKMLKMASLLQFTLPGVPSIYYGDEIGMQGMKDPFNRACMDWDNQNEELHQWYKRLGEIRNAYSVFADGEFCPVYFKNGVVAYERRTKNNTVLTVVNVNEQVQTFNLDGWNNSYNVLGDLPKNSVFTLNPYTCSVLYK